MTNWYTEEHATLGDRLTVAREQAGLTLGQLANQLGVRAKTLRDWENDLSEPRANRLQMLSALLGVSLRWLMTGQGQDVVPLDEDTVRPDANALAAMAEVRGLRAEMLNMADRLARLEKTMRAAASGAGAGHEDGHDAK